MSDFLLELRCEEVPARMQAGARADLLVLDARTPGLLGVPATHALDALIFATDAPAFRETWVAGRRIQAAQQVADRFAAAMETLWT